MGLRECTRGEGVSVLDAGDVGRGGRLYSVKGTYLTYVSSLC